MSRKKTSQRQARAANGPVGSRQSEAEASAGNGAAPNPELVDRTRRRQFSPEYKLRIVREADACSSSGDVGALLRREGLYTSHLSQWRKQLREGALTSLSRARGRRKAHPLERENAELRRRVEHAELELAKARKVIEVQGNVSALLGELLEPGGAKPDESSE